jgi:hypothetical protein
LLPYGFSIKRCEIADELQAPIFVVELSAARAKLFNSQAENQFKSSTYRTVPPTIASILAPEPTTGQKKGTCFPKNARNVAQSSSALPSQGLDYQCKEYEAMTLQDALVAVLEG